MLVDIAHAATEAAHVVADVAQGAAEVAHTSEPTAGPLGSLGINKKLFLAQLFNFTLILLVLWKMAYKPLLKIMNERQVKIQEGIDNATEMQTRLAAAEQDYEKKMTEAKQEAAALMTKSSEQAAVQAEQQKEKTQKDVAALVEAAKRQIEAQKVEAKQDIAKHAAQLVSSATAKLLEEEMSAEKSEKAVKDVLAS